MLTVSTLTTKHFLYAQPAAFQRRYHVFSWAKEVVGGDNLTISGSKINCPTIYYLPCYRASLGTKRPRNGRRLRLAMTRASSEEKTSK